MAKGWPVMSCRIFETMMLGEVPTRVTRPPISEPKAIGIRSWETDVPFLRETCAAIGMNMASAPTFFVTIDKSVTAPTSTKTCRRAVRICGINGRMMSSTTPERAIAALTRSAATTITTTSSANPEKALFTGTMPVRTPASSPSSAIRS